LEADNSVLDFFARHTRWAKADRSAKSCRRCGFYPGHGALTEKRVERLVSKRCRGGEGDLIVKQRLCCGSDRE
jgi:hypothetical protein